MNESVIPQLWRALRRRIWPALFVFIVLTAAWSSVVFSLPDVYRASATLVLDTSELPGGADLGGEENVEAHMFAMTSRVLSRERLRNLIEELELYPDHNGSRASEVLVERARRDIRIEPKHVQGDWGRRVMVAFEVSYNGFERNVVANVVNRIAELFMEENERFRDKWLTYSLSSLR
jgi:polysaccharide biosynthesis transport protein